MEKFVADAMLGSLARKLRIFGFDTLYVGDVADDFVEALCARQNRALLTSDKALCEHARKRGIKALIIVGRTDLERLRALQSQLDGGLPIGMSRERKSRCAECNGELVIAARKDLRDAVPPGVLARHRLFYRCRSCSKVYWRGKHWQRLRRLSCSLSARDFISAGRESSRRGGGS